MMRRVIIAALSLCTAAWGGECYPDFIPAQSFDPGENHGTSALADLDGDGNVDLTTGESILFGEGGGRFGEPVGIPGRPEIPFDVIPHDFDKDGLLDLALGSFAPESPLTILFGRVRDGPGDPLFEAPVRTPSLMSPWHLVVADFNRHRLLAW